MLPSRIAIINVPRLFAQKHTNGFSAPITRLMAQDARQVFRSRKLKKPTTTLIKVTAGQCVLAGASASALGMGALTFYGFGLCSLTRHKDQGNRDDSQIRTLNFIEQQLLIQREFEKKARRRLTFGILLALLCLNWPLLTQFAQSTLEDLCVIVWVWVYV